MMMIGVIALNDDKLSPPGGPVSLRCLLARWPTDGWQRTRRLSSNVAEDLGRARRCWWCWCTKLQRAVEWWSEMRGLALLGSRRLARRTADSRLADCARNTLLGARENVRRSPISASATAALGVRTVRDTASPSRSPLVGGEASRSIGCGTRAAERIPKLWRWIASGTVDGTRKSICVRRIAAGTTEQLTKNNRQCVKPFRPMYAVRR